MADLRFRPTPCFRNRNKSFSDDLQVIELALSARQKLRDPQHSEHDGHVMPMEIDLGAQLRRVRTQNGLSQRELAKRAGVTNSTISLIESNGMNPSVGALKRILDGIPISLGAFFALEAEPPQKTFYSADELIEIGKGLISYRQVGQGGVGRQLQILKERYAPGADSGQVSLSHEGEEGGIILSGRLEVTVDGERRILGPGDAYYFDSRRPHRFRCVGRSVCEVVSACSPPTF